MPYPVIPPDLPPVVQAVELEAAQVLPVTDSELADRALDGPSESRAIAPAAPQRLPGGLQPDQSAAVQFSSTGAPRLTTQPLPVTQAETLLQPTDSSVSASPVFSRASLSLSALATGLATEDSTVLPAAIAPSRELASRPDPLASLMSQQPAQPNLTPASRGWVDGGVRAAGVDAEASSSDQPMDSQDEAADEASPPVQLSANRQIYDQNRQIVNATGDVLLRSGDGILNADQLWLNLPNRIAVAEGNVAVNRGGQVIRGDRAEYNLLQETGMIFGARGEVFLPTLTDDFSRAPSNDLAAQATIPLSDRVLSNQPLTDVTNPSNITGGLGTAPSTESGSIRRLRFEATSLQLTANGWEAVDIRLTNDPFSPPELEFRADRAQLVNLSPEEDELRLSRSQAVFDQSVFIGLPFNRLVLRRGEIDSDELNPLPTGVGFDDRDRGGLFIERSFNIPTEENLSLRLAPQFLVSRFLSNPSFSDLSYYGIVGEFSGRFGPRTTVRATASLPGLEPDDIGNRLRASIRGQQLIGTHTLALEYSYRNRLFNGSLGFQDVQSSVGAVLTSPVFEIGNTGINISYQLGGQYITAETDVVNLLTLNRPNDLVSLGRFQGSLFLSRGFILWEGEGLPPTPEQGLRYSPRPVVPFFGLSLGLRGVGTYYTNRRFQEVVTGTVGISGQFGNFSRQTFDYTRFNLSISQDFVGGQESPFLFDRNVDNTVLSGGIVQQIYGPVRAGFQTSINLSTGAQINTDYILEYSRRTYGFILRYNAVQGLGFVGFRLSDFDWSGNPDSFGAGVRPVSGGVIQ